MKARTIMIISILSLFGCASHADPRDNYNKELETPRYQIATAEGQLELRVYEPYVIASVTVEGDFDSSSRQGFRLLAGYIFGANTSQTKIAMTSPVSIKPNQQPETQSEQLTMTAPVTTTLNKEGKWTVTFSMPSKYSLETLPIPEEKRVQLSVTKPQRFAVNIFSGRTTPESLKIEEKRLREWIKSQGLETRGDVTVARYNDPFTFPWNRRNEIMIEVP